MSLFDGFKKRTKLNETIKQVEKARSSAPDVADDLFREAYLGYAEVLLDDPIRADALYHWAFALLHQARSKTGEHAIALYQEALIKFDYCLLLNPAYLGAVFDGGVAYMELARLLAVPADDKLYDRAKSHFERANTIHKGTAFYNLACVYALRNQADACREALENARNNGSLPSVDSILKDSDMDNVIAQDWFIHFIETLQNADGSVPTSETVSEITQENVVTIEDREPVILETLQQSNEHSQATPVPQIQDEPVPVTTEQPATTQAVKNAPPRHHHHH